MADFRFLAPLAVVLGFVLFVPASGASHVQCGDLITQDTVLDSDLDCSEPGRVVVVNGELECVGGCRGIAMFGERITLDLAGHSVTGPGRENCRSCFSTGVEIYYGSTLRNGTISGFDVGVSAGDAQQLSNLTILDTNIGIEGPVRQIVHNTVRGSWSFGIGVSPASRGAVTLAENTVTDTRFDGITIATPEDVLLDRNVVTGSGGHGIFVNRYLRYFPSPPVFDDGNYVFRENRAHHNALDGIHVEVASSTFTKNKASFNGDLGISAVPGVVDGGKNKARRNGNPAQCVGVRCK